MDLATFEQVIVDLRALGFADADIHWSENAGPPENAEHFASEAIFVICNSGMQNDIARAIFAKVMPALRAGRSAFDAFKHPGKAKAIDQIWAKRESYFTRYMAATDKVRFCESLPFIGQITKYHLAKNFGADVAKPDVHLQRLAERYDTTAQKLCEHLAGLSGLKARTVDLLLWRACANGVIDSRSHGIKAPSGPNGDANK